MLAKELVNRILADFTEIKQLEAVALAGSSAVNAHDQYSDIDLYIYSREGIPVALRKRIALKYSKNIEINNQFWETGDEWQDSTSGTLIDLTYRSTDWTERELKRVLENHQASMGYSTCLWFNILNSEILFDKNGWLRLLKESAETGYPEKLKTAVLKKNYPVLGDTFSSYKNQIIKALKRNDFISFNHRVAALLASYFDVVFALNEQPHPGEKRILETVKKTCSKIPQAMEETVTALTLNAPFKNPETTVKAVDDLLGNLRKLMRRLGY